jgi:uncharacterized protein (TIGR00369 family)
MMPSASAFTPVMTVEELNVYLDEVFPQLNRDHADYRVTAIAPGAVTVHLNARERHLRPGNTLSGPSLFTLADIGGYACALSHIGRQALAVTTNLNINFMRKAEAGLIIGEARILKLGRALMVFDIAIHEAKSGAMAAHATGTYAIPPNK